MRFLIKQKYFAIRDGFYITDEGGRNAYFVQGKMFTIGKKLTIFDNAGREVLFLKQRIFRPLARFDVYQGNDVVATIKRTVPLFKKYKIISDKYGDLKIKGNILAWSFSIETYDGRQVAAISKKVLKIRDTYTVDVFDKRLETIVLGVSLVIDAMHHRKH